MLDNKARAAHPMTAAKEWRRLRIPCRRFVDRLARSPAMKRSMLTTQVQATTSVTSKQREFSSYFSPLEELRLDATRRLWEPLFSTRLRDKRFDVRNAARQSPRHPLAAFRGYLHVVFDAHADAFVFFERWLNRVNELYVLGGRRQIVQRVRTNVYAWLVRKDHARFECRAAAHVVHIHAQ